MPVQYSIFVYQGNQFMLDRILEGITKLISPDADDVRAYHLPERCEVMVLGRQLFPEGVVLSVSGLDRLLRELTGKNDRASVDVAEVEIGANES